MRHIILFVIVFLSSHVSAIDIVFRGTGRIDTPENVKARGGFYPRGSVDESRPFNPPSNISLFNHATGSGTGLSNNLSGYVSTTSSRTVALQFVRDYQNYSGYIYAITPTANFINVNQVLLNYSPHPAELEYAAMGVIHWWQVVGWYQVEYGQLGAYSINPDYNSRFVRASGVPPEISINNNPELYGLAGFPNNHSASRTSPWITYSGCAHKTRDSRSAECDNNALSIKYYISYMRKLRTRILAPLIEEE